MMKKNTITFEQQIGARIAELRRSAGVLQKDLADYLKVTVSTVSHYESGTNMPQPAILVKIADYFGVSVDYIFGQTDLKIDWKTFRREITLLNGSQVSLESVINNLISLSEQSQADICKLIELYKLDDRINHKPRKATEPDFNMDEANQMMLNWLNEKD